MGWNKIEGDENLRFIVWFGYVMMNGAIPVPCHSSQIGRKK